MDVSVHDGCIGLEVDLGETDDNTIAKGYWEQCGHQTAVLANGRLKPNLEAANFCSQYENMTISQSSDSITSSPGPAELSCLAMG